MGGFSIINNDFRNLVSSIDEGFKRRGFSNIKLIEYNSFTVLYVPKLSGKEQFIIDDDGSCMFIVGSLWYHLKPSGQMMNKLVKDLREGKLDTERLSGTFTLVYVSKINERVNIYHDYYAVNRFYIDQNTKIVSSSWLTLMWLIPSYKRQLDKHATLENLVIGFNLGIKTWLNSIKRVKYKRQLPGYIKYHRNGQDSRSEYYSLKGNNFKYSTQKSAELVKRIINCKLDGFEDVILGLSSGYDSRLVTSALNKENLKKLLLYTYDKTGDADLEIAQLIAGFLDKKIKIKTTFNSSEIEVQENIYKRAFCFFDGQMGSMLQYSKEDYAKSYRDWLFGKYELHLSGVGGELYRNYNYDNCQTLNYRFWINHYFNGGKLNYWLPDSMEHIDMIATEIKGSIGSDDDGISFYQRKRFYGEVFLSDWHGIRNSVENQYTNYYSPFTDPEIIEDSFRTIKYQGSGGRYEAAMINFLSHELASFPSEYGHNMMLIPLYIRLDNIIRGLVKTQTFGFIRNLKSAKIKSNKLNIFESQQLNVIKELFNFTDQEIDWLVALKREHVLSLGYILFNILYG